MQFAVSEKCLQLGLRAGAIVFRNLHVGASNQQLRGEIGSEARRVGVRYPTPQDIRAAPEVTSYQEVLRKVGVNPRRAQSSVERLLTLAHKRGDLPLINDLVDAYNLVSIRTLCSLGAHDLDRIAPHVMLRLLTGQETFAPLGSTKTVPVVPGEFGYVDGENRLLCRLDVRQAEFSKVTQATINALLIVEGTSLLGERVLRQAFADVIALATQHCGGTAEIIAQPFA